MRELYTDELELEDVEDLLPATEADPTIPDTITGARKLVWSCRSIASASDFKLANAALASASEEIAGACFGPVASDEPEHAVMIPAPQTPISAYSEFFIVSSLRFRSGANCSGQEET